MPRFFVAAGAVAAGRAAVEGRDAGHLARSLRVRPGERIVVVTDAGTEHGVDVDEVTPARVAGPVRWSRPATGEPRLRVEVLQALCREGMDDAVEALAEVGAAVIRPVVTRRTVARPDVARAQARLERWRTIAREGAALAGRAAPPAVHPPALLDDALAALAPGTRLLALAVDAARPLARVAPDTSRPLAVVVGPEGGLDPDEVGGLRDRGAAVVHLGARVLRARLAGAFAVGILLTRSGDLDGAMVAAPDVAGEAAT